MSSTALSKSPLGKPTEYITQYQPTLLHPIPRALGREVLNIRQQLPFQGIDIWNGYELSWLDNNGKPHVAIAEFHFPCTSPNLIESKSFKLYLNSFNMSQFADKNTVVETLNNDLSQAAGANVTVKLVLPQQFNQQIVTVAKGVCIDDREVSINTYLPYPAFLAVSDNSVTETLFSNLLKSNCPATGLPDWATVMIDYQGKQIDHNGLLKYIISYRKHTAFHEQCVEKIFTDIMHYCQPERLLVYARYTRRGGLDINPLRANFPFKGWSNLRVARQ